MLEFLEKESSMAVTLGALPSRYPSFHFDIPPSVRTFAERLQIRDILSGSCERHAEANLATNTITVQSELKRDEALNCLVFELVNIAAKPKFEALTQQIPSISIDEYVKGMERIEFDNARLANEILSEENIRGSLSRIPRDFDLHYLIQQSSGHSQFIAESYARKSRQPAVFRGTWHHRIDGKAERDILHRYLKQIFNADSSRLNSIMTNLKSQAENNLVCKKTFEQLTKTAALLNKIPALARHSIPRGQETAPL